MTFPSFITKSIVLIALLFGVGLESHGAGDPPIPPLQRNDAFEGEQFGKSKLMNFKRVEYFTPETAVDRTLKIQDGRIYGPDGNLMSTWPAKNQHADGSVSLDHKAIVVLDEQDRIQFSNSPTSNKIHHSSLVAGKPVKFAGEMLIENGKVILITDRSGHYMPTLNHTLEFMKHLEQQGLDLSRTQLHLDSDYIIREFLDSQPSVEKMRSFVRYALPDALYIARTERNPVWLMKYASTIRRTVESNPEFIERILRQTRAKISPETQALLLSSIEKFQGRILKNPELLQGLARTIDYERYSPLLVGTVGQALDRAIQEKSLSALSTEELRLIGSARQILEKQDPEKAQKMDRWIRKLTENHPNRDLELFYSMLVTNREQPFETIYGQFLAKVKKNGSIQSCDLLPLLKSVVSQN